MASRRSASGIGEAPYVIRRKLDRSYEWKSGRCTIMPSIVGTRVTAVIRSRATIESTFSGVNCGSTT